LNRSEVWKRLLWKELREDRWPLAIAVLAMTALYALAGVYRNPESSAGPVLAAMAAGAVHLVLAIWGATKGDSRRGSTEFEFTHLPTSPMLEWATSVGVPTIAAALLGLWFGYLAEGATGRASTIPMPLLGALDLALTYAACYFMAALVSLWAGILIGMAQIVGGTLLPIWQNDMATDSYTVMFAGRTLAAALVGALILAWLYRNASPAAQKAAALGAAVLILYGPVVVEGLPTWVRGAGVVSSPKEDSPYEVFNASQYITPDRAIVVQQSDMKRKGIMVCDHLRSVTRTIFPKPNVEIIGAFRDGRVFLAQQIPYRKTVSIIVWDYLSGRTRTLARFETRAGALVDRGNGGETWRLVSPDGRYVLLEVGGLIGNLTDIWAVDLKTGRGRVALLSLYEGIVSVAWKKDRVLIGEDRGAYQIDLRTLQGRPFTVADAQEGAR
jgi:hypothetical protein